MAGKSMDFPPLPRKVKGAVSDYAVTRDLTDQANAGECVITPKGCEIRVTKVLPPGCTWQTFLHELIHKWEHESHITPLKDRDDDSDVDRLATAILADFLRNGWTLPGS